MLGYLAELHVTVGSLLANTELKEITIKRCVSQTELNRLYARRGEQVAEMKNEDTVIFSAIQEQPTIQLLEARIFV